ncbi:carboxylesterase/lipase family protein [Hephaestia sp. GCM10023244]|uniref:carboxylesterase/lipase family protein n=1 Tax=unclassified Hephaestia TaxID=2631281 RepID=UPI0020779286|nr:carboxylesterase/lipase family protein [Hephaestia sp. MAHUQ-44]MCM8731678.1 carboxylesterase/lipase family protein [Hephaestia sp. MAHUQ-44]
MSGIGRRAIVAAAGMAPLVLAPGVARAAAQSVSVTAPAGRFEGDRDRGVLRFRGIRYGRAERFLAPVAVAPTRDPIAAKAFGPVCPQLGDQYGPQSEDCLFLNIWTPQADRRARLPVVLYIHGGAYSNGSVTDPLNDGYHLAARGDCVVVTVNHRLNAFGYLYLARLDPRFADSGNNGQLDLILALQWVRDNIAAFGGDPDRVMTFGTSGGGAKIATMMGMPAAKGLFHRAATMSGQQVTASGPLNASARTRAYLDRLGVRGDDLSPLLTASTETLVAAGDATDPILGGTIYFGPVLDMKWLTRHPFWPDANPQSTAMPMMLGNTHDETRAFVSPGSAKVAGLNWDNIAERIAPELRVDILPEWVISQYRAHFPSWTPHDVFWGATTAGRSWRGQVIEAEARARAGAPAWVYQVDFASPTHPDHGAPHGMDIPLVFGTLDGHGSLTGTGAGARAASKTLQDAFVAFAATGDPNVAGGIAWPRYDLERRATLIVDVESRIENDPRRWQRELFARVPYIQPGT